MVKIKRFCKERKGFSLIEVIIALAILVIAVLALESSYYSYYRNVTDLRIKTIGQDLAQLQLEDIQNLSVSVLDSLIDGGSWPSSLSYTVPNYPSKPVSPPPSGNKYYNDYDSADYANVYDSIQYGHYPEPGDPETYFPQDGSFRIEHLTDICGTQNSATLPALLLPSSIKVRPVLETDASGNSYYDYTLILHKEVFPNYKKRIIITDKTPGLSDNNRIFSIVVTVYWKERGTEKSITITGEKSYAKSN